MIWKLSKKLPKPGTVGVMTFIAIYCAGGNLVGYLGVPSLQVFWTSGGATLISLFGGLGAMWEVVRRDWGRSIPTPGSLPKGSNESHWS